MKCMLICEMLFNMNWNKICEQSVEACSKYVNCQLRHVIITMYVEWYARVAFAHIEWIIYAHVFHSTC